MIPEICCPRMLRRYLTANSRMSAFSNFEYPVACCTMTKNVSCRDLKNYIHYSCANLSVNLLYTINYKVILLQWRNCCPVCACVVCIPVWEYCRSEQACVGWRQAIVTQSKRIAWTWNKNWAGRRQADSETDGSYLTFPVSSVQPEQIARPAGDWVSCSSSRWIGLESN